MTPDSLAEAIQLRLVALASRTRVGQFIGVGIVGAGVDNAVLVSLVEFAGVGFVPAKVMAWLLAIAVIFVINERWTFAAFGAIGRGPLAHRLLRSYVVRFAGFLFTMTVYTLLITRFDVWYLAANVVAIGCGFFVNYTCESLYTWQVHR